MEHLNCIRFAAFVKHFNDQTFHLIQFFAARTAELSKFPDLLQSKHARGKLIARNLQLLCLFMPPLIKTKLKSIAKNESKFMVLPTDPLC